QYPQPTLPSGPGRAIRRGTHIIVVPAIFHPLRRISRGIIKTEPICLECADRQRLFGLTRIAFAAVGLARADGAAPPKGGIGSGAGGVFPFSLGRKPIDLSRLPR